MEIDRTAQSHPNTKSPTITREIPILRIQTVSGFPSAVLGTASEREEYTAEIDSIWPLAGSESSRKSRANASCCVWLRERESNGLGITRDLVSRLLIGQAPPRKPQECEGWGFLL